MSANGNTVGHVADKKSSNGGTTVAADVATGSTTNRKQFINVNLVSLKCLLFFFFGGLGCLLPFLPLHMLHIGLDSHEIRIITIISSGVSIIGPLLAGPIADRVAASRLRRQKANKASNTDDVNVNDHMYRTLDTSARHCMYLRVMIGVCCVFAALFYGLLLMVPRVEIIDVPRELRPDVRLACDEHGAVVHQERCRNAISCHRWSNEDLVGALRLSNCNYACYASDDSDKRKKYKYPPKQNVSSKNRNDNDNDDDVAYKRQQQLQGVIPLGETTTTTTTTRTTTTTESTSELPKSRSPHVCYNDRLGRRMCRVFTKNGSNALINVSLRQAVNHDDTNDWCAYPIDARTPIDCRIPEELTKPMNEVGRSCVVVCRIDEPYAGDGSVLGESQCRKVIGNEQLTFWMYLSIRALADIFPTAALTLVNAAVVIATRETSAGRGDVGRQLAFGALGVAIFGPLTGYITNKIGSSPYYYPPLILHALLALTAAFVALSSKTMPLSPPEWWWHTRSGLLALPLSAVRKYGGESTALFFVLVLAGTFWSVIASYLPIHLALMRADALSIGLALTLGALPAVLFLWKSEHFVDYCGHSNLLITAFVIYTARFTALSVIPDVWWALLPGALEVFTLEITWITTIVYFRHLIPRQMTATGQALPVAAHFCIGRTIGAIIGASVERINTNDQNEAMRYVYQCLAIGSVIVAILYFVLYHGVFKPRCHAQTLQGSNVQTSTILKEMNGKQNYSPLMRVYHNGMGRKGQFRY